MKKNILRLLLGIGIFIAMISAVYASEYNINLGNRYSFTEGDIVKIIEYSGFNIYISSIVAPYCDLNLKMPCYTPIAKLEVKYNGESSFLSFYEGDVKNVFGFQIEAIKIGEFEFGSYNEKRFTFMVTKKILIDCPVYSPPAPDYCKYGSLQDGGYDSNGCKLPPKCACTKDAKVCPDGSVVGRVLPYCDFEVCPNMGCVDKCGDNVCAEIVCLGTGCPCPENANSCPQDCQPKLTDQVKCIMWDTLTAQECYSEKGSCKGDVQKDSNGRTYASCSISVTGRKGEQVMWKSSCGGYAYTTIDGQNDYAEFKCGTNIKESVKCVFGDSNVAQECYSEKGSCKGVNTCSVEVTGYKGEQVMWKSSCGGYAYTVIDGQSEYAKFSCKPNPVCGNNVCEDGEDDYCPPCANSEPACLAPCRAGTCKQDCRKDLIEIKIPSDFTLLKGQSAKVTNFKNMKIQLNEIYTGPDCTDPSMPCPMSLVRPYVKVAITTSGGCEPNANFICLNTPESYSEYTLSLGESVNLNGAILKLNEVSKDKASFKIYFETGTDLVVYLNSKFQLKKDQTAVVKDYDGMRIKYLNELPVCMIACTPGFECPPCAKQGIALQVSMPSGNTVSATNIDIRVGEKKEVFGATIQLLDLGSYATLIVTRSSDNNVIYVNLGQKFKVMQEQTAIVQDYRNLKLYHAGYISEAVVCPACPVGVVCEPCPTPNPVKQIILDVSTTSGNTGVGTRLTIPIGSKKSFEGVNIHFIDEISNTAILLVSKDSKDCFDSDKSKDYSGYRIESPITKGKYPDLFIKGYGKGKYLGSEINYIYGTEPDPQFGKVTGEAFSTYYDHCVGNQLNEAYCTKDGMLGSIGVSCPNGCDNGACKASESRYAYPNEEFKMMVGDTIVIKGSNMLGIYLEQIYDEENIAVFRIRADGFSGTFNENQISGSATSNSGSSNAGQTSISVMPVPPEQVVKIREGDQYKVNGGYLKLLNVYKDTIVAIFSTYELDMVDISVEPTELTINYGDKAVYEITIVDKHHPIVCIRAPCNQPLYIYNIEVDNLPFFKDYKRQVTLESGQKISFDLVVKPYEVIMMDEVAEVQNPITSVASQSGSSSGNAFSYVKKVSNEAIPKEAIPTSQEESQITISQSSSQSAAQVNIGGEGKISVFPSLYRRYKFTVKATLQNDFLVRDSDTALLNIKPKEGVPPTPPPLGNEVSIKLYKGWNLISLPGKLVKFVADENSRKKLSGFVYLKEQQKYVSLQEAEKILQDGFSSYLASNSFWVYSYNNRALKVIVDMDISYNEMRLKKGWNLVPVTEDMVGGYLKDIKGSCEFEKLSKWNSALQRWDKLDESTIFTENDLYYGFIIKAKEDCYLSGSEVISPPSMPE